MIHPFSIRGARRGAAGFTLAEAIIGVAVLVVLVNTINLGLHLMLRRRVVDRAVYNVEQEQDTAAAIVSGLFKMAASIQLYPSRWAYANRGDSALQTSGNFAVILDADGNVLACFEYLANQHSLSIYRGGVPGDVVALVLTQNISIIPRPEFPDAMFRLTDGLPQADWTVYGRFEKFDTYVLGVPLRMR